MNSILIAAAVTSAIAMLLAGMLVLCEKYLANYGKCKIDINDGTKVFELDGGESLLNGLKSQEIFIPSACGGRGTCAYCKCKITEGGGVILPTEQPLLTEQDIADNIRISCQVKIREDMRIEIPPTLFEVKQYSARVESITDLTYDIKEVCFRLDQPADMPFKTGQYIQLETQPYPGQREVVSRAYSISNQSNDNTTIETIIRLVPKGICTTWIFKHLQIGQDVIFNGPHGEFTLSDTQKEMVWIAGGSGMAPFWSMIRHMKANNIARKTTYFFGAVQKRDLFLTDQLRQLESELDWFTYVPALSSPADSDNWDGQTGLITEVVGRCVPNQAQVEVYLCGSPGMIDAAIKVIKRKGITNENIFYDKFE